MTGTKDYLFGMWLQDAVVGEKKIYVEVNCKRVSGSDPELLAKCGVQPRLIFSSLPGVSALSRPLPGETVRFPWATLPGSNAETVASDMSDLDVHGVEATDERPLADTMTSTPGPRRMTAAIAVGSSPLSPDSSTASGASPAAGPMRLDGLSREAMSLDSPTPQQNRKEESFWERAVPNTPEVNARIQKSFVYIVRIIDIPQTGTSVNFFTGPRTADRAYTLLNTGGWVAPPLQERLEYRRTHEEEYKQHLRADYKGLPKIRKHLAQPARGEHGEYPGPCLTGPSPPVWNEVAEPTLEDV
jgi:hypothetical protein